MILQKINKSWWYRLLRLFTVFYFLFCAFLSIDVGVAIITDGIWEQQHERENAQRIVTEEFNQSQQDQFAQQFIAEAKQRGLTREQSVQELAKALAEFEQQQKSQQMQQIVPSNRFQDPIHTQIMTWLKKAVDVIANDEWLLVFAVAASIGAFLFSFVLWLFVRGCLLYILTGRVVFKFRRHLGGHKIKLHMD
jgi:hypothetical protein